MSASKLSLSALLLALAAVACTPPRATEGQQCVFNDECRAPLVCAGRLCRAPCQTDRDCNNGWRCAPSGTANVRVCLPPGAAQPCMRQADCAGLLVCGLDGFCGPQCQSDGDCALRMTGATCVPFPPAPDAAPQGGTCSYHPLLCLQLDGGCPDGGDASALQ